MQNENKYMPICFQKFNQINIKKYGAKWSIEHMFILRRNNLISDNTQVRIYFNIVDLCGILPYRRIYPYKCGININFDILTTQKDQ